MVYFYLWSAALFDWLDKGQTKQAKYVLGPLLAVAVGAALMFLAVQPARAEERNNRLLRQLIYGANMGLSVLLLLVALVVANLIVSPRLPNKLDVTETGFYSLAPGSIEFIQRLPEPVTAYAILPDNRRRYEDIRRLLENAQSQSGGKFTAKYLNPNTDVGAYTALKGTYPVVEANDYGVLLTVGEEDQKRQLRHSFVRDDEFSLSERGDPRNPQPPTESFVGESRLVRELLFLSEGDKRAVVYFTQSAGELDIGDGAPAGSARTARRLKEYLTRNYLDVRPLKFEESAPKVPDDAAVVIVAEPQFTIPAAHAAALRQYMTDRAAPGRGN